MEEFALMVQNIHAAKMIARGPDYSLSPKEQASTVFRRSLFAVKDIEPGDMITTDNVRSIRPSNGIAPKYLMQMLGKKAKTALKFGQPVTREFLEELE